MYKVKIGDYIVTVNNGVLSSENSQLSLLAGTLLAGTFGRFDNDEIYRNRDKAIAHFIADELHGKVISEIR